MENIIINEIKSEPELEIFSILDEKPKYSSESETESTNCFENVDQAEEAQHLEALKNKLKLLLEQQGVLLTKAWNKRKESLRKYNEIFEPKIENTENHQIKKSLVKDKTDERPLLKYNLSDSSFKRKLLLQKHKYIHTGHKLKTQGMQWDIKKLKPETLQRSDAEITKSTSALPFRNPPAKDHRTPLANLQIFRPQSSTSFNPVTEEFIEKAIEKAVAKAFLPIQHWMAKNDSRMDLLTPIAPGEHFDTHINIECVEDVQKLEINLMSPEFRKQIASSLSTFGGTSERDMLRRIFKYIFPKSVLIKFCWIGTSEKFAFRDLIFIKKTICKAVSNLKQFNNFTESDYDSFSKNYVK